MGLSSTTDKQRDVAWRLEFEALGEQLVFKIATQSAIYNDEAKRQTALGWLSERARLWDRREWALSVAIAGVLIGIIGLFVALH